MYLLYSMTNVSISTYIILISQKRPIFIGKRRKKASI